MLKVDTLRMIKATGVNWPSGFRGEDFLNKFMPYETTTDILQIGAVSAKAHWHENCH
jgi:hypothetical protein